MICEQQNIEGSDFSSDLIKQFVEARKKLGISQLSLDHRIGLTQGQIAKWETRARKPTLWNAYCWACALGCDIKLEFKDGKQDI